MTQVLKKAPGWRLGWNPNATAYKGLVGSDEWAIELTATEFQDFCRLLLELATTMDNMAQELVEEEKITCEAESDQVWLEVAGYPHAFSLRLILQSGRGAEGNWSANAVPELITAVQNLTNS